MTHRYLDPTNDVAFKKLFSNKDLLPVVVISIIGQKIFDDELPCINYHCLKETNTNKQYLFSLMYVFVELGKFDSNKIENDIDQWLHLLKCAHNEQEPPKEIKNSSVLSAYEELEQYKWNASEHDAYIRAKLAMEAEEIKVEEYLEKITKLEEKVEQAEIAKAEEIAKKMLSRGKNAEEVAELTGLSLEKVNSLRKRPF
jgi:predicted transposase/invertase (TIGR01784 family)